MPVPYARLSISEGAIQMISKSLGLATDEMTFDQFEVANGVTEGNVFPSNLTTVTFFYMESNQTISYVYTTSQTTSTITAGGFQLHNNCSFTSFLINNASGSTANIKVIWAGT